MLTRNAAKAYSKFGVRINEVRPGFTDTRMTAPYAHNERYQKYVNDKTLFARLGTTEEIAKAVLFLLSDDATFITGASLAVDGGWLS